MVLPALGLWEVILLGAVLALTDAALGQGGGESQRGKPVTRGAPRAFDTFVLTRAPRLSVMPVSEAEVARDRPSLADCLLTTPVQASGGPCAPW